MHLKHAAAMSRPDLMFTSPVSMLEKLERTFYRREAYGAHQIDWAVDFATTAWHINDWIAFDRGHNLRKVQDETRLSCPAIMICELLCNGFKHLTLRDPRLIGFEISRDVSVPGYGVGVSKSGIAGHVQFNIAMTPSVVIVDREGRSWDVIPAFLDVLRFWQEIVLKCKERAIARRLG